MTLVAEPTLGPTTLPHFLVKQLHPKKHGLGEAELVTAIQEIELQTQISGASMLKVHVADPDWTIITSGLIAVSEDGLLNELEVEFPEKTGFWWRLCAVEGSTEVNANLVLTFEDRTVARLRQQWGHKTAGSGTSTRAQFVKALVGEANLKGHLSPPIRFVSPGVNRKEPVAESAEEKKEKQVQTPAGKQKSEAEENKTGGIHAGASFTIKGQPPSPTQRALANEVLGIASELNSGPLATEALIEACIAENDFTNNPGGGGGSSGLLQLIPSTAASLGLNQLDVKGCVKAFLQKGFSGNGGAIEYAQKHPNAPAYEVAQAIQGSGAGASSKGASNYGVWATEAQTIIHVAGGVSAGGTTTHSNESGVGQLSRGTTTNPDEDSWDCIQRLAQEVNWHAFTDGRNGLFYMDGPDLIKQRPVLYVNPAHKLQTGDVTSHVVREDKGGQKVEQYGVLVRPLSFNYDNVAFTYRATHKVKGKLQRKSKIAKPQSPSEIRMNMLCGLTEYRAGAVFVFQHCGPISENGGRWVVADATRECMKYPYTKFLLVPATEPLPEPRATELTGEHGTGSALAAFEAANTLSQMELPYLWGGGHGANALNSVKKGGSGLDCSGSVCWVLKQAGMYGSSSAETSGELASHFGEAGKGKEMTVWANANHVFIEFNVSGHGKAQGNTNGPQNGFRLYTLEQTPTYNMSPETEGYTARHFKGT